MIIIINSQFIIVPRILFSDSSLSQTDRCVLGLIISLTFKENYCYASNKYLANYLNVSARTITDSLSKLKELNYIIIKNNNRPRKIFLNVEKIPIKPSRLVAENCELYVAKTCDHNIKNKYKSKYNNNTNNLYYESKVPYWMEHPEICKKEETSLEEQKELKELLNIDRKE